MSHITYKMTRTMYIEIRKAIQDSREWKIKSAAPEEKDVIDYINQTFGLIRPIKYLNIIGG